MPFQVRRKSKIDKDVGGQLLSAPEGFIPVPVFVHMGVNDGATCKATALRKQKIK